ncbi:hypothetical protein GGH99_004686, partial [Coemansia sp. RSA 1285]
IRLRPAVGVVAVGGVAAAVAHEGYVYWTRPGHECQPYRLVFHTLSPDFFKRRGPSTDPIVVPGRPDSTAEDGSCALGQGAPLCLVAALLSLRRKRSGTIANYDAGIDRNGSCNTNCENKCNGSNSNFAISDNNCSDNSTMNNDRNSDDCKNTDSNGFGINTGCNDNSISDGDDSGSSNKTPDTTTLTPSTNDANSNDNSSSNSCDCDCIGDGNGNNDFQVSSRNNSSANVGCKDHGYDSCNATKNCINSSSIGIGSDNGNGNDNGDCGVSSGNSDACDVENKVGATNNTESINTGCEDASCNTVGGNTSSSNGSAGEGTDDADADNISACGNAYVNGNININSSNSYDSSANACTNSGSGSGSNPGCKDTSCKDAICSEDGSKRASQDVGNSNGNGSGCEGAGYKYIDSNSNNPSSNFNTSKYSNYINNMATVFADKAVPVKQVPAFAALANSASGPNNGLDSHRPPTLPFLPCDGSRVCANKANIKRCKNMFSFSCFDEKQLELGLPFMEKDLDDYEIVSIESIDSEDYDMVYAENGNSMRAIDSLKFKAKEVRRKASMAFREPADARPSVVPGMYQDSLAAGSQPSLLGGKGRRKTLAKKVSRIFSKR